MYFLLQKPEFPDMEWGEGFEPSFRLSYGLRLMPRCLEAMFDCGRRSGFGFYSP